MARRRTGTGFEQQQLRQLQQQAAATSIQAASTAATVTENIDAVAGMADGIDADKQDQIDALVARLDAAAIP